MNHLLRRGLSALLLCGALSAQALPTAPYQCLTLRSDGQSGITNHNGAAGQPLSPVAFTAADFAAACSGTAVYEVSAAQFPCASLSADPLARWISPNPSTTARSTLYCQTFQIPACGVQSASIRFSFCADDQLGDPANGPNPIGVYLNGQPIAGFGGLVAPQTTWSSTTIAPLLQTGTNRLQVYVRDTGYSITGVIYSATICYVGCRTDEVIKLRSGNGPLGGPDNAIRMLAGFNQTPIAITPANLTAAATGPAAVVVPPNLGWCPALTADPLAQWISTDTNYGPRSALYSHAFPVSTCNVLQATLSFSFSASSMLGDPFGVPSVGLFVNQNAVPLSAIDGLGGGSCNLNFTANINPAWLNGNAQNRLHVYVRDIGHLSTGVLYSATLRVIPCPPQTEVIALRSGNGSIGSIDSTIRCVDGAGAQPLSGSAFTWGWFNAAVTGSPANIVWNAAWAPSLTQDPQAKWVSSTMGPPLTGLSGAPRTTLFAHPFTVNTCASDIRNATLICHYNADDGLGDPQPGGGPNPLGLYLNDIPIPGTAGDITTWPGTNTKTITIANVAPYLQNGANVLHVYLRDRNNGVSGVMYSTRITISPCDWRYFGDPCGDTVPNTFLSAAPLLGETFQYSLRGDSLATPQFRPCFSLIGLSDQFGPGGAPLPLELAPFGAAGCRLFTSMDSTLFLLLDGAGRADQSVTIPNDLSFDGLPLHFQTLTLGGGANPLGLSATRGIAVDCRRP